MISDTNPCAEMNAELGKQQACDQRTGDTDKNVADDPEAGAADDLSGQPSGDEADKQNNKNTLVRHMHQKFPLACVSYARELTRIAAMPCRIFRLCRNFQLTSELWPNDAA